MSSNHMARSNDDTPVLVETVTGPVPVDELGMTLTHEHLFGDLSEAVHPPVRSFPVDLADAAVTAEIAWLLREDPYASRDNARIGADQGSIVADEVTIFVAAGGRTVIDSSTGVERQPAALLDLARRTGLQIVMSGGWCLAHGDVHTLTDADIAGMTAELVGEIRDGVELPGGERVRVGSIGEIGVGPSFTAAERATLVASCLAQVQTGVPLFIHLPGWQRRGHEVLDIVAEHGVDPSAVVLCHMDPSGKDPVYQREIADRGVWLEFDMIAMELNFPGEGQSPSVQDTVDAVAGLLRDGHGDRILLSHDMFLKVQWARNGGSGFAYVPVAFLPRLVEAGVDTAAAHGLMTTNPAALFTAAARTAPPIPSHAP